MKKLLSIIISAALVVSGYSQTRNVLVGTNNTVVQPTNFWSADASNARSGLGLGSAATNAASAFQPSSSILSNLVSGGALTFSNITVGISNVTGLQSALDGKLGTNPTLAIANISNLQTTLDGKLGTNPTLQISNIAALQTALDGKLSGSFPIAISNVSGLQTSLDGKLATNPTLAIANITGLQTNLDSKLSITGNAVNLTNFPSSLLRTDGSAASLTNFPANLLRTTGDASNLTNFPTLNQNTTGSASNVTGIVAITNGGSGANTASGARTAFGLGTAATNPASAFQPSSTILTNLSSSNGGGLTNIAASSIVGTVATASNITGTVALATNVTGVVALVNGGTGATNATGARTALGVGASDVFVGLTNLGTGAGQGFSSSPYILGSTNSTAPNNAVLALGAAGVRSVAGLTLAALTNTDNASFRTAIGLDTSSFQPSSIVLSNLASSNGSSLTNIAVSNVVGALSTNGNGGGLTNLTAANITGTISVSKGGTGATNAATARTNLGLGWSALTNTNASTSLLGVTTNGQVFANAGTNVLTFTNAIAINGTAQINMIEPYGGGSGINILDGIIIDTNGVGGEAFSWGSGVLAMGVPISFSTTNIAATTRANLGFSTNLNALWTSTNASDARSSVGLSASWLTNTVLTNFRTAIGLGAGDGVSFYSVNASTINIADSIVFTNPSVTRTNLGLGATWLTNTDVTNFRTAVGLGTSSDVSFATLNARIDAGESNSAVFNSAISFDDVRSEDIVQKTRTNLGLGATWLTNTNVTNFRSAIGLGASNDVTFNNFAANTININNLEVSSGILQWQGDDIVQFFTNKIVLFQPIEFDTTNIVATTRTNLGLGETNNVTFSALTLSSDLTLGSGDNIVLSTTTGTKIGTATNQLLGFYNQIPITRPSSTGVTTNGFTANSVGNVHANSTFTGGIGTNAYTISDIVAHLKSLGLIAP